MLIDCDTCAAPVDACRDCVVTMLLRQPPVPVEFDDDDLAALGSLADAGLVSPLRLVAPLPQGGRARRTGEVATPGRDIA